MKVEFSTQSGRDGVNPAAQTGRLVNLFREPLVPGGKAVYQLRAVPGMAQIADLDRVFMRALMPWGGGMLSLCGGVLSTVSTAGATVEIGDVGESEYSGLSENTGYATIVSDGGYWYMEDTTLTAVAFDYTLGSVSYIGGYTVVTEKDGRRFAWSDLADPTTFDGLSFASAEINNDPIIRGVVLKDLLLLFKASGFELWGVSGLSGADAFQRVSGSMEETGLKAYGLLATFPNGLAFVGTDGRVHVWAGGLRPISTPPVEVAIQEYDPQRVFYYELRGHGFICLTFRDCPAWCYDIATGEWHERAEGDGPWTLATTVKIGDDWHGGTTNGKIVRLATRCTDFDDALIRRAVSLPLSRGKPFIVSSVAVYPQTGVYRQTDDNFILEDDDYFLSMDGYRPLGWLGADEGPARISLRTTRDGVSFGPEKVRELGSAGERKRWINWRNLGQFQRMAAFELTISSVHDVPLLSAAEVEIT